MEELLARLKKAVGENNQSGVTSDASQQDTQFVPRMIVARPSQWRSAPPVAPVRTSEPTKDHRLAVFRTGVVPMHFSSFAAVYIDEQAMRAKVVMRPNKKRRSSQTNRAC